MSQTQVPGGERIDPRLRATTSEPPASIRIGEWEASPSLNLLRRGETTTHLEPKAMELLCFLARRRGEVVSRDELLATLWQGLVVGDDALTQAVIKLRKALGDNPREPTYIQTVPKRGYRLVAQVSTPAPEQGRDPIKQDAGRRSLRPLVPGAIGLTIALMVFALVYLDRPSRPDDAPVEDAAVDAEPASVPGNQPTVSVFPFQVLGDDPDQLYLARGLAAELASDLSRLSGLTAIGADRLPGFADNEAAPSVHASFQVWGGVQRREEQISVEVRLIEAATGRQLWSQRYDRPFGDLFAIQDEIGT
ncbi:MAG: winged helix-turn-helix domain-containing protein, partial [Planctomycetes bacterium]|nr:winged helix-turn-helix domain-containing protein [Planctomycetota bacterium]